MQDYDYSLDMWSLGCIAVLQHVNSAQFSPLVLLQDYDYSLDMWSLGCMLAGMIFRKVRAWWVL